MSWLELAFLHWPISPELLQRWLPGSLKVDTHQGQAWIGVVPFQMSNVGLRGCPSVPGTSEFLELNVRTYVTVNGRPGVWFFSLDAANALAVHAARLTFALPYYSAQMKLRVSRNPEGGEVIDYESNRKDLRSSGQSFRAQYGPIAGSAPYHSKVGSLEHWLTERYCLYSLGKNGVLYRGEIYHPPWPLQKGWVTISKNSMTEPLGVELPTEPALVHFAKAIHVRAWYISRVRE